MAKKKYFLICPSLDSKSNDRVQVGKVILSYNAENRKIYATVVANITLGKYPGILRTRKSTGNSYEIEIYSSN